MRAVLIGLLTLATFSCVGVSSSYAQESGEKSAEKRREKGAERGKRGGDRGKRGRRGQRGQDNAPKVGDVAPVFTLKSLDGESETDIGSFNGEKPVVLFFGSYT